MPVATHCPACKRRIETQHWHNDRQAHCRYCEKDIEFVPFPALTAVRAVAKAQEATMGDDATCFFHVSNRAEAVCASCGRLLCSVCAVDFAGECLCPSCIANRPKTRPDVVPSRMLWDSMALGLAALPLLMWPLTIATAPTAIGLAIFGWNKPGSLVRGAKLRLVLAMMLGAAQVVGWTIGLIAVATR